MKPEQCRAARAWLDWSQEELAGIANVSTSTVRDFEKGRRTPIISTQEAIKRALEEKGISFKNRLDGKPLGIEWTDSTKSA
jgi:ribosome-binding protein aMBF1 (putative translation factor)